MIFARDDVNREHVAKRGVMPGEAEEVIRGARNPFPRTLDDEKRLVWRTTRAGRYLQVIFVYKAPEELRFEELSSTDWAIVHEISQAKAH